MKKRNIKPPADRATVIRRHMPNGPKHALNAAIAVLGPYPWARPAQLEIPNWVIGLPEVVTEEAIAKQVKSIGSKYLYDLDRDAASVRVKDALLAFREIAELCNSLADRLAGLSERERYFFTLVKSDDQNPEVWRDEIFNKLPSIFDRDDNGRLLQGSGALWLRDVANHSRFAMASLSANNRPGGRNTGDAGGKRNLHRIHLASPSWMLVKMSWQLFEWAPHCQPSGTARGPLHDFLGHVHEWVTGENVAGTGKFESNLKDFAKPWRQRQTLIRSFNKLIESFPKEPWEYLSAALSGFRPDLRSYFSESALEQAEKLQVQLTAVEKITAHGPR